MDLTVHQAADRSDDSLAKRFPESMLQNVRPGFTSATPTNRPPRHRTPRAPEPPEPATPRPHDYFVPHALTFYT